MTRVGKGLQDQSSHPPRTNVTLLKHGPQCHIYALVSDVALLLLVCQTDVVIALGGLAL